MARPFKHMLIRVLAAEALVLALLALFQYRYHR